MSICIFSLQPVSYFQIETDIFFKTTIVMIPEDSSVLVVKGEHLGSYKYLISTTNLLKI